MKRSLFWDNVKRMSAASLLYFLLYPSSIMGMSSPGDPATPIVEVPQIPLPAPAITGQGPETVALSEDKVGIQGNWMKKKEWLIKSNEVFDEIQSTVLEIQGSRKSFNEKYHAIDEEFDNFYKDLSLDQGKLQELFDSLVQYLEKKKKKKLDELSASNAAPNKEEVSEKDYLLKVDLLNTEIKQHKEELEQLKLDLKSIDDLDKSIIERLKRVDEQISQAKEFFDKAKNSIEDLWNIIDDKLARTIYYELKGSTAEKLKSILTYLKEDLSRDFDSVIETSKSQMSKAKESIKKLEDKGLIIKNRSQRIEQLKLEELQKIEQAKKEVSHIPTKDEVFDLKKIKKQPTLWYEKMYDYITTTASRAYRFVASLFDFSSTKKAPQHSTARSRQIKPATPPPPQQSNIPATLPSQPALPPAHSTAVLPQPTPLAQNSIPTSIPSMPLAIPTASPSPQLPAPKTQQPLAIPLPQNALGGMPLN